MVERGQYLVLFYLNILLFLSIALTVLPFQTFSRDVADYFTDSLILNRRRYLT